MRKVDVLGFEYDDAQPAFVALGGGVYYYHLKTKRMYSRAEFNVVMTARGSTFAEGELGEPTTGWLEQHKGLTDSLLSTTVPTVPNTFAATADGTDAIDLTWVDASNNEAGFRIEMSDAVDGTFVEIGSVAPGVLAYKHTGLETGTAYFYEIYSFNVEGESATAAAATATTD